MGVIKQKLEALQKVLGEAGTAAYQQAAQQQAGSAGQAGPSPQGDKKDSKDAVDVDYKVVDDKK